MVFPVPGHEALDTDFEGRGRPVVHVLDQVVDVGIGGGHVPRLHRHHLLDRRFPQKFLQGLDECQKTDRVVIADIEQTIGGRARARVGRRAVPIGVGRGRFV